MKLGISTPSDLKWVNLVEGTMILGRSGSCSITLSDPILSRQHCAITRDGEKVICSDLGSSNGTWYQGNSIERQDLEHGSVVEIGDTALLLITENSELTVEPASFRSPDRVASLLVAIPELDESFEENATDLFSLGSPEAGLLDEAVVDHVIHELLKIMTHSDEGFRSLLTRTIDRSIRESLLNKSTDLNQLRAGIREILEKERS